MRPVLNRIAGSWRRFPRSVRPLSPSLWYCSAPAKPNGVVPMRLTVMPNASCSQASVAVWPAFVMPLVLLSASVCRKLLAPLLRSEPGE